MRGDYWRGSGHFGYDEAFFDFSDVVGRIEMNKRPPRSRRRQGTLHKNLVVLEEERISALEEEIVGLLGIDSTGLSAYEDGTIQSEEITLSQEQINFLRGKYNLRDTPLLRRNLKDTLNLARHIHNHRGEVSETEEEIRSTYDFLGINSTPSNQPLAESCTEPSPQPVSP